jgi:1-acyl-sn-glycerol-3-phosphate acyltransferase
VGLQGTEDIQPVGSNRPRLRGVDVRVRVGEPITVAGEYDGVATGRARRDLTDRIMTAIAGLTGQELAGAYNERPASTPA